MSFETPNLNIPLLEKAAAQLKESGSFHQDLTRDEVASIMQGVVTGLLSGQDKVKASVPTMNVMLKGKKGGINGLVVVESPIEATIGLQVALGNDTDSNRIKTLRLNVKEEADEGAKVALALADIPGKTKEVLRDPNKALFDTIKEQLEPRGVALTSIGLQFNEDTLSLNLKGN